MKKVVKDKELLKDLFKQAADIAEEVPESMQEAAFNRALDALLSEAGLSIEPSTQPAKVRRKTQKSVQPVRGDNVDYLNKEMDRTKYPRLTPNQRVLDRSLMLLEAAKNDHGIDGLTSTEIANVLTEKFRIPTTYNAISMALSEAGSLVDRRKIGRSFQYRIMRPGEDHLGQLDTESESSSGAVKSKRSSTAVKKKSRKKESRPAKGRPGPKQAIDTLSSEGFFSEPRTISSIMDHLETKKGYVYKANELSTSLRRLVRDGELAREKNEQNQYEYTKPSN